ncbi:MAG: phage integrase N-terminal SAM-like domain-containing protein [Coriobacteriia bacterium]
MLDNPKLLERMHGVLQSRHYSARTEKAYCSWVERYIRFHRMKHPAEMGEREINAFLTHLAVEGKVSASTQNQALAALLFLYRYVLGTGVGNLGEIVRARKPVRLPVVLTPPEVRGVLERLHGSEHLAVSLMYGTGLRLMECLRLRVLDIDYRSQRQGRQGSNHDAAREPQGTASGSAAASKRGAPAGSG